MSDHALANGLVPVGGKGPPSVFVHANGYPLGSYRQLLTGLAGTIHITGMNLRPLWSSEQPPQRLDWHQFSDDLITALNARDAAAQGPVWMIGHSLGAVVAMLTAARRPELCRGLVLIEPVFFLPEALALLDGLSDAQLDETPMIARTLTRPERFDTQDEAFAFYRSKRSFAGLSDSVLADYVDASLVPNEAGSFVLAYSREWEAAAYRSAPDVWEALRSITVPVLGLRGESSDVLAAEVMGPWGDAQPQAELLTLAGGHLLPLEAPDVTASVIADFVEQVSDSPGTTD